LSPGAPSAAAAAASPRHRIRPPGKDELPVKETAGQGDRDHLRRNTSRAPQVRWPPTQETSPSRST
jgi:hypothetical protein